MLHRKDYIAIAGAIRQSYSIAPYSRLSLLTDKLSDYFQQDNPLYDDVKFREAARDPLLDPEVDLVKKHKKTIDEVLGISIDKLVRSGKAAGRELLKEKE